MFGGKQAGERSVGDSEFGVDVLDVGPGRLWGDMQAGGNLLVGPTAGQKAEDFDFSVRQSSWPLTTLGNTVAGSGQDSCDGVSVQMSGPYLI